MDWGNRWFLCKTCNRYIRAPWAFLDHKPICQNLKLNSASSSKTSNAPPPTTLHRKIRHSSKEADTQTFAVTEKKFECNLCQYATNRSFSLKRHLQTHSTKPFFVCKSCDYRTNRPHSLKLHSRNHTGETPFKCAECPASFNNRYYLLVHFALKHEDPVQEYWSTRKRSKVDSNVDNFKGRAKFIRFKCEFCEYNTNRYDNLEAHIRTHTGVRPFVCKVCKYACKQRSSLKVHSRCHTRETPFKCAKCSASFNTAFSRSTHFAKQHEGPSPDGVEAYLRRSAKGETKDCSFCPKVFRSVHNRKMHERIHTNEKPFECQKCSETFSQRVNLKRHMLFHGEGEIQQFKCDFCDYTCRCKQGMATHTRIHTGEKPFKCNLCSAAFKQPTHLKMHLAVHNNLKNYKCHLCEYATRCMSSLKTHIRIHTSEKPYACKVCDHTCSQLGSLKVHNRMHTGEKPFKCDMCEYAATASSGLKSHRLMKHTEHKNKAFKCSRCNYATVLSSLLKKHMTVHDGQKEFKCEQCGFCTKYIGNLKSHMKTHKSP